LKQRREILRSRIVATLGILSLFVASIAAATIKQIRLTAGHDDVTRLAQPVYDNPQRIAVEIEVTGGPHSGAKFVRRTGGRLPATRGPEYDLDRSVDLASLLREAVQAEAAAMGFAPLGTSPKWQIKISIGDLYLESRQVYMGATLFYGYADLQLDIRDPAGPTHVTTHRVHTYWGGYNAGFGRRDEAEVAAAHLIIEGAQEIVAVVNRRYIKLSPRPEMQALLDTVRASGARSLGAELRAVSLSGLEDATPVLLKLLAAEPDENNRSRIIDAIAILGSVDAVAPLASRYSSEDQDCRYYILKAMDLIGGTQAMQLVSGAGMADKDTGPKRLASRITAATKR
jgi:hypothetical protein